MAKSLSIPASFNGLPLRVASGLAPVAHRGGTSPASRTVPAFAAQVPAIARKLFGNTPAPPAVLPANASTPTGVIPAVVSGVGEVRPLTITRRLGPKPGAPAPGNFSGPSSGGGSGSSSGTTSRSSPLIGVNFSTFPGTAPK